MTQLFAINLAHPEVNCACRTRGGICYRHLHGVLTIAAGYPVATIRITIATHLRMLCWEVPSRKLAPWCRGTVARLTAPFGWRCLSTSPCPVSSNLSKIPYDGFSPVRLQTSTPPGVCLGPPGCIW